MKDQISLSIPSPCTEKWENFSKTSTGGFCQSCQKNVVDFTQMSDLEIINYWKTTNQRTCGRFKADQLKTYHVFEKEPSNARLGWLKAIAASAILFLTHHESSAQEQLNPKASIEQHESQETQSENIQAPSIFRGIIKDEYGEAMPAVTILLEGTTTGTSTDIDGVFKFPKELNVGDILICSFIGYQPMRYIVKDQVEQNIEFQFAEITFKACEMELMGDISFDHIYEPQVSFLGRFWNKMTSVF